VILVSEGFILEPRIEEFREVTQAAMRVNAVLYFVDARQLNLGSAEYPAEFNALGVAGDLAPSLAEETGATVGSETLATDTGGFSIRNTTTWRKECGASAPRPARTISSATTRQRSPTEVPQDPREGGSEGRPCPGAEGLLRREAPGSGRLGEVSPMHRGLVVAVATAWLSGVNVLAAPAASYPPLALHPENPRYFLFRGKPTVLVTSGEHYGAVLNLDFDYVRYLDALAADGLNHTRLFSGTYREVPSSFAITDNTLAPKPGRYVAPGPGAPSPATSTGG